VKSAAHSDVPPGTWLWLQNVGCWLFPWLTAIVVRRRVHRRERVPATGPVVFVANHSSMLDGPVIASVVGRRPAFLIKQEMFRGPLGFVLRRIGQIPIVRGTVDRAPLLTAIRVLRGGGMIGIFPEGTRASATCRSCTTAPRGWRAAGTRCCCRSRVAGRTVRPARGGAGVRGSTC
jgi:1-acyl-sn-glycerol-3-phosphate acyltransferase